jgi:Glycosyltransferase family 87
MDTPTDHIRFSPSFQRLLLLLPILNGLVSIKRIVESFLPPDCYRKDFIQEYLMAKAIRSGINPYLPLPDLAGLWMQAAAPLIPLRHPTPHPPIVGLLSLPLGGFDYRSAALLWLAVELLCLLGAIGLFLRWWGAPVSAATVLFLFGFALGWGPVIEELWLGQLSSCLLLLLLGSWLLIREGGDIRGGVLLGAVVALKLMAWPIVLFLALRRKWNAVLAAGATTALANLAAMVGVGTERRSRLLFPDRPVRGGHLSFARHELFAGDPGPAPFRRLRL